MQHVSSNQKIWCLPKKREGLSRGKVRFVGTRCLKKLSFTKLSICRICRLDFPLVMVPPSLKLFFGCFIQRSSVPKSCFEKNWPTASKLPVALYHHLRMDSKHDCLKVLVYMWILQKYISKMGRVVWTSLARFFLSTLRLLRALSS